MSGFGPEGFERARRAPGAGRRRGAGARSVECRPPDAVVSRARSANATSSSSRRGDGGAGVGASAGARRARGRETFDRGRRNARQDDDHLDGGRRPRARGPGPELPGRRRSQRERKRSAVGRRRSVRVRGGRERWVVPADQSVDRRHHERGCRPRRLLSRRPRGDRGRVRRVPSQCERVVACGDDPGVRAVLLARHPGHHLRRLDPANDWTLAIDTAGPGGARGRWPTRMAVDHDAAASGGRCAQPAERRRRHGDRLRSA